MKIWVDADATPNPVKDILYRAAQREKIEVTLVANCALSTPPSPFLNTVQVRSGFDEADHYIEQRAEPGDLVITADIPLAAGCVEKGAIAINPRGEPTPKRTFANDWPCATLWKKCALPAKPPVAPRPTTSKIGKPLPMPSTGCWPATANH